MPLIKRVCGYPLIIKDIRGSKGRDSEYVASESELLTKMAGLPKNKRFLLQRFIQNEYDWGIMVVNGVVVSGEKSYPSQGEFRNNTCNGAKEHFVEIENIPRRHSSSGHPSQRSPWTLLVPSGYYY
jgi:glutathione synthase/RimK-type ligase-like ATP-grasp enzyme